MPRCWAKVNWGFTTSFKVAVEVKLKINTLMGDNILVASEFEGERKKVNLRQEMVRFLTMANLSEENEVSYSSSHWKKSLYVRDWRNNSNAPVRDRLLNCGEKEKLSSSLWYKGMGLPFMMMMSKLRF